MHALVVVVLILLALLMIIRGLSAFVRYAADDSPHAAPESPAIETYARSDDQKSASSMTSRN
jgi:Na+-transporting methylmalonyl-CoA/oxaloacetate decarboxylase gamma subunit